MVEYHLIEEKITEDVLKLIENLSNTVFNYFNRQNFLTRLKDNRPYLLVIAVENNVNFLGFKAGYAINNEIFFSWLGAVKYNSRRKGIATTLMKLQHDWCLKNKFRLIETHTTKKWEEMLSLNLKHAFLQVGTFIDKKNVTKIILQKALLY